MSATRRHASIRRGAGLLVEQDRHTRAPAQTQKGLKYDAEMEAVRRIDARGAEDAQVIGRPVGC
jgi:hypothetical protein